ncbi:MAG: hypothetical protein WA431_00610, partial [Candidatus Cybelea sp.]
MKRFIVVVLLTLLSACASPGTSMTGPPNSSSGAMSSSVRGRSTPFLARRTGVTPITHVIIVVQENRTTDNLFQGLPGAN